MAAIRPFRHLIVYPLMLRERGRNWQTAGALDHYDHLNFVIDRERGRGLEIFDRRDGR
jgi:hypothetical protein